MCIYLAIDNIKHAYMHIHILYIMVDIQIFSILFYSLPRPFMFEDAEVCICLDVLIATEEPSFVWKPLWVYWACLSGVKYTNFMEYKTFKFI